MNLRKTMTFLAALLALAGLFAGCAKKTADDGIPRNAQGEIIIRAVTENMYPPYSYVDDNNLLTGYDVEVVRAINSRLAGYDIQIEGLAAEAAYMALQSHTTDVFFDELAITPEREEAYYFSAPYYVGTSNIIVKKGRTDMRVLKDLEGKTVGAYSASVQEALLFAYNENEAAVPIKIVPLVGTVEQSFLNLQNGLYDAYIDSPITAMDIIARNKLELEIVQPPLTGEKIGLVFAKDADGLKLKNLIDPVIRELEKDGTLSRLSLQFTGYEYIP
jgi:L-cystine transport system substrate-binding protein